MKDMVTNGTGNSRYLKTSLASGTTWESALAMLREGTFPIDLNGLNNGGITQLGSAYSKANVLPDDVCALLGLNSTTAEPKDAFGVVGNPAELWMWEKFNFTPGSYRDGETHTNVTIMREGGTIYDTVIIYYSDSISVDEYGMVSLINPSTFDLSYNNYSSASVLKGKYIRIGANSVAFIPTTATFSRQQDGYFYEVRVSTLTYIVGVKPVFSHVEYVSSPNSFTYPENGQSGDYWYTRLGQIGEGMTKIETGSYVGTGTYGEDNPNSLTFWFEPKLVMVRSESLNGGYFLDAVKGVGIAPNDYNHVGYSGYDTGLVWSGNTLSWYADNAKLQMNDYTTYYYVAIG